MLCIVTLLSQCTCYVAGEQEVNILAEILDNSADVFEDLAKEIGSEDIIGKYTVVFCSLLTCIAVGVCNGFSVW
jgi:hypothetical protein